VGQWPAFNTRIGRARVTGLVVAASSLVAIAAATLHPTSTIAPRVNLCLWCDDLAGVDFAWNVLLFIPLGVGLRLAGLSRLRVVIVVSGTSLTVEMLQYLGVPGRVASVDDVVSNSTGGALGMVVGDWARPLFLPTPVEARRLVAVALFGWLAVLGLTLWLFAPALPRQRYLVWLAPDRGPEPQRFDQFTGRVLAAHVGSMPLRGGRVADSRALRTLLLRDRTPVTAVVTVPRELPARQAPILTAFDVHGRELFMLGEDGADLTFRMRRRSSVVRLQRPTNVVWAVFSRGRDAAHDTVTLAAWTDGYWLRLRAERAGVRLARDLALRPTWGWTLVLPFENTLGPQARTFTAEWLALVLFPAGFYGAVAVWPVRGSGRGIRPAIGSGVWAWWPTLLVPLALGAALISGLIALPRAVGLPDPPPWEWNGALAGIGLGAAAGCVRVWLGVWLVVRRVGTRRRARSRADATS
jgi:VanZ family protein